VAGGATVGSTRAFRLDPNTLPARSSPSDGGSAAAAFIIEDGQAVLARKGASLTVPLDAYRGVAVRMEPVGSNGAVRAFVELLHNDPELTLPLAMTDDPYDIAGDWQAWGRTLNLPLLIIGQDGSVGEPLVDTNSVHVAPSKPRRRHSYFAKRRPRFLARRKVGHVDEVSVVFGREIIARH
jgi:hypothetical protein